MHAKKNCIRYQRSDRIEIFNPLTTASPEEIPFTYVNSIYLKMDHIAPEFNRERKKGRDKIEKVFRRFIFKTEAFIYEQCREWDRERERE